MPREKRSTVEVLKDMAKAEEEKFLSEAEMTKIVEKNKDLLEESSDSKPPEISKELKDMKNRVQEEDVILEPTGGTEIESHSDDVTELASVTKQIKFAKCPVCDEHRYEPKLANTQVVCTNCRRSVKLEGKV